MSYYSYGGNLQIKNPKFPIKEKSELYELVGHILGDGFISIEPARTSTYTNTSKELINRFCYLLNKIFGKVETGVYEDKRFNAESIIMPKIISIILIQFFPELLSKTAPERLFRGNQKNIISFVRGFFDDEGCVTTSSIIVTSKNRKILEDISKLLISANLISSRNLSLTPKKQLFILTIKGRSIIDYFGRIGFVHPEKQEKLKIEVDRKLHPHKPKGEGKTKSEIVNLLFQKPMSVNELSAIIGIQQQILRKHLKSLANSQNVEVICRAKYKTPIYHSVKIFESQEETNQNKIINILTIGLPLSTREISNKIGLSKDQTLIYLRRLEEQRLISFNEDNRTFYWRLNESR